MTAPGESGNIDSELVSEAIIFEEPWLKKEFGVNPRFLCTLKVRGDGMEPTLKPGELVLIDRSDSGNVSDGIFAVRFNNVLLLKRLQRTKEREIRVTSDNPRYKSFTVSLSEPPERFSILGRVLWHGRKL